ncbi:hypothetical protein AF72_10895 [Xylella taiwanensis]|nr:hypothetical protein AB672_08295 [Xylella taiwanensis]EWS77447.1 hypothetical protein AF72_10895 [Xylella taiwanensis]
MGDHAQMTQDTDTLKNLFNAHYIEWHAPTPLTTSRFLEGATPLDTDHLLRSDAPEPVFNPTNRTSHIRQIL